MLYVHAGINNVLIVDIPVMYATALLYYCYYLMPLLLFYALVIIS